MNPRLVEIGELLGRVPLHRRSPATTAAATASATGTGAGATGGEGLSGILCIGRDLRVRSWVLWAGKDHVDD